MEEGFLRNELRLIQAAKTESLIGVIQDIFARPSPVPFGGLVREDADAKAYAARKKAEAHADARMNTPTQPNSHD